MLQTCASPSPTPLNPTPATCHKRKTEVALQFPESCAAEVALRMYILFSAVWMSFFYQQLRCNKRRTALQDRKSCVARDVALSCRFQAPTFRLVRGLLGTGRTPPSNPPCPPLLRGQFGIEIGSNQEIDVESMSKRC